MISIVTSVIVTSTIVPRKNLKIILLAIGLILNISCPAFAKSKSSKYRAYSYFDDGGKSTQANCDPERKVPRKLKTEAELKKSGAYLGSEHVESELQAKGDPKQWKHFFSAQSACEKYLAQQQKTYESKNGKLTKEKPEVPEDTDDEEAPEQSE